MNKELKRDEFYKFELIIEGLCPDLNLLTNAIETLDSKIINIGAKCIRRIRKNTSDMELIKSYIPTKGKEKHISLPTSAFIIRIYDIIVVPLQFEKFKEDVQNVMLHTDGLYDIDTNTYIPLRLMNYHFAD